MTQCLPTDLKLCWPGARDPRPGLAHTIVRFRDSPGAKSPVCLTKPGCKGSRQALPSCMCSQSHAIAFSRERSSFLLHDGPGEARDGLRCERRHTKESSDRLTAPTTTAISHCMPLHRLGLHSRLSPALSWMLPASPTNWLTSGLYDS